MTGCWEKAKSKVRSDGYISSRIAALLLVLMMDQQKAVTNVVQEFHMHLMAEHERLRMRG